METDAMFLEFEDDLDNDEGGSSSVGSNTESSSQQPATPTPRRLAQSRLLELECHVQINGHIPMTMAPGTEKPISPYVVLFSQAIDIDLEEARANPPNALVGCHEDWYFLYDHYMSRAFQYELTERKGELVDRVELFRETHIRAGTFVSQAAKDAHNQMLELQSQPTTEGSQPLSEDEICD
ncbi:CACTA en-spm transposon protein [Cucumis melo var. makuwa]|uniref:CACTA en-spm transposon protein n=1 Tax=Cucumis melo var. makuwa TaxID=1194695 RepID=A0A5A7T7G6_CUCMM|nr:CACTA en-spm transposon protein [Cucumis melo var. makuwa]TYK01972.1 CACTA en-spm transposon protein [Cucumis melo var. makuwa]